MEEKKSNRKMIFAFLNKCDSYEVMLSCVFLLEKYNSLYFKFEDSDDYKHPKWSLKSFFYKFYKMFGDYGKKSMVAVNLKQRDISILSFTDCAFIVLKKMGSRTTGDILLKYDLEYSDVFEISYRDNKDIIRKLDRLLTVVNKENYMTDCRHAFSEMSGDLGRITSFISPGETDELLKELQKDDPLDTNARRAEPFHFHPIEDFNEEEDLAIKEYCIRRSFSEKSL